MIRSDRLCEPSSLGRASDRVGQRGIEFEVARLEFKDPGQGQQAVLWHPQIVELPGQGACLFLGRPDIGHDAWQHDHAIGVTAGRASALLDVGIELRRALVGLVRGEDRLGVPRGEILAVLRGSGLHEQG